MRKELCLHCYERFALPNVEISVKDKRGITWYSVRMCRPCLDTFQAIMETVTFGPASTPQGDQLKLVHAGMT